MDYKEAMGYITSTYKFGSKAGLERIERLLDILGNPQKDLKFVHIAGTNGKGSLTAYMSSILEKAGLRTGVFVSPYLQRFSERIRIGQVEISDDEIVENILKIKNAIGIMEQESNDHPTEFEILTAMAMMHYKNNNCDIVVLEVGMGGVIDSTNIISDESSVVSVITTIGFDHMQYLGNTLPEIAEKKAGIIKKNGHVVLYPQVDEAMAVFEKTALEKNAVLEKLDREDVNVISETIDGTTFDFGGYKGLEIKLLGTHQVYNASLAVMACKALNAKGFEISEDILRQGLKDARWAGRFEIVSRNPMVVIDGAHNLEGAFSFSDGLKHYFGGKKLTFICGFLNDKDYGAMLEPFIPMAKRFVTITPDYPTRALPAEELRDYILKHHENVEAKASVEEALEHVISSGEKDDIICVFGSLYFIGFVRDYFGLK